MLFFHVYSFHAHFLRIDVLLHKMYFKQYNKVVIKQKDIL